MQSQDGVIVRTCKVLNSNDIPAGILPADTVFVDKGSTWENPFTVGVHGTRSEVLERYNYMLANSPEALESLDLLHGKDLISHDAPLRGHADTLLYLASINYAARLEWAEDLKALYAPAKAA